jgi:hypothetical protein
MKTEGFRVTVNGRKGYTPPHGPMVTSYEIEDGCFIQDGQRSILARDQSDRSDRGGNHRLCGHNIDRTTIEWRPLLSEVSRGTQRLRHASGTRHRSQNHRPSSVPVVHLPFGGFHVLTLSALARRSSSFSSLALPDVSRVFCYSNTTLPFTLSLNR